jgi:hypothetical protein
MKARAIAGAAVFATGAAVSYRTFVRPWHERWGATDEEVATPLVGDELIAEPAARITRAITIDAPPADVWPWVVQIGADRGGFYSYDRLENLFGLRIRSAEEIVPEWQERAVGDLVTADARGRGGWYVMEVRPGEALVLEMADLARGGPTRRTRPPFMEFSWAFVLRPLDDDRTRLLVRERVAFGNRVAKVLGSPIGFVSFVMTQKMMRGIEQRAEASSRSAAIPAAERIT